MNDTDILSQGDDSITPADEIFPLRKIIVFTFFALLSCVLLPCAAECAASGTTPLYFLIPAYAVLIAGTVYLLYSVRKAVFTVLVTLVLFFLYSVSSSPMLPAAVAAVVISLTFGGFVISVCSKKYRALLLLLPLAAYLGSYALTGDWMISLISLVPLFTAAAVGFLQRKNAECKTIVVASSVILIVLMCAIASLVLWSHGMLDMQSISDLIDTCRRELISYMNGLTVDIAGSSTAVFDAEYVESYVTYMFNMLPSMLAVICFVTVYLSHAMQLQIYKSCDLDLMANTKTSKITVSVYCAALFIVSYILSLSTDVAGNQDMLSAVSGNLRVILTPALLLVGFDAIGAMLRKLRGFGFIIILLLAVAIFTLSAYIILIISAIGAFYVIIKAIDAWAARHYSQNNRRG